MKATAKQVQAIIQKWRPRLGLMDYEIGICVHNAVEEETDTDHHDSAGYISVFPELFVANMTINAWHIPNKKRLDYFVVHELVHITLWPLGTVIDASFGSKNSKTASDMVEQAVVKIAKALTNTIDNPAV